MRVLTPWFVERWAGRMLNIHPSLLPLFRGTRTHERALAEGVLVHGCTVHFVVPELDAGPIVAQAAVPVRAGRHGGDLAARVLAQEHAIYPRALRMICCGEARLGLEGGGAVARLVASAERGASRSNGPLQLARVDGARLRWRIVEHAGVATTPTHCPRRGAVGVGCIAAPGF